MKLLQELVPGCSKVSNFFTFTANFLLFFFNHIEIILWISPEILIVYKKPKKRKEKKRHQTSVFNSLHDLASQNDWLLLYFAIYTYVSSS